MTNFSNQNTKKRILTPERAVFFVPVIISIVISIILLPLIFIPGAKFIREQKSEIQLLNDKIDFIPIYKIKLEEIESIFLDINNQNNRLIDLLAGEKDLTTVLSKLNNIALKHNVKIIEVKPNDKISTLLTKDKSNDINESKDITSSDNDKLLVKSIEKYPIDLKIMGDYIDILNFIRDLELLQTIVLSSNLKLYKSNQNTPIQSLSNNSFESIEDSNTNLALDFTITFYGRKTTDKSIRKQQLIKSLSEGI